MIKRCYGAFAVLILAAAQSYSATLSMESETVIRSSERSASGSDEQILPIYEYMRLDVDELGSKYLSLHVYGWGRLDAADSGYYDDQGRGELIYGYLEYSDEFQRRSVRLGRQHILEGVANESVDGIRLSTDLWQQFSVSVYGGLPANFADTAGSGSDSIWGGRLSHHLGGFSDVGVSYKTIDNDGDTVSSMLGIDSSFFLPMNMSLFGRSTRNMESDGWAEHDYTLSVEVGDISIQPYYSLFRYADYFGIGSATPGPFIFLANTDEQLETTGIDLSWRGSESWRLGAAAKNYSYDLKDSAMYMSASVTWLGDTAAQAGGEVGYMLGDMAENDYIRMRLFCYFDQLAEMAWLDFISGDILYTLYDQEIYGQDSAYFLSLGSGRRFLDDRLEIKMSADYSKDPYFNSDLSAMLTVIYRFDAGF